MQAGARTCNRPHSSPCSCVVDRADETVRAQLISLDGLLDYDESDTEEATMELSLAAEALQEMLSRDYGDVILTALLKERCAWMGYFSGTSQHPLCAVYLLLASGIHALLISACITLFMHQTLLLSGRASIDTGLVSATACLKTRRRRGCLLWNKRHDAVQDGNPHAQRGS